MHDPDIIQITEIIPKNFAKKDKDDLEKELHIPGYTAIANNKPIRGVMMFIKSSLDPNPTDTLNDFDFDESLWITLKLEGTLILLGCIYRNTQTNDKEASTLKLTNLLNETKNIKYDKMIITGDFNFPKINWNLPNNMGGSTETFIDCTQDLFLTQMIKGTTRSRAGHESSILDLLFTNDETSVSSVEHFAPLGLSDHDVLMITLNFPMPPTNKTQPPRFNFKKANYSALGDFLTQTDWSNLEGMNVNEAWTYFRDTLYKGFENFVPKTRAKNVKKQPIWMNKKCMKSIKKKYALYKKYKKSQSYYNYQNYIKTRNESKKLVKKAIKNLERQISKDSKTNTKSFWRYVNSKLKRNTGISNLLKEDGTLTQNDQEKAECLASFFKTVFTREDTTNIPTLEPRNKGIFLPDLILTNKAVQDKLSKLDPQKSMGPDKIPNSILKNLSKELSIPLTTIFNKSLSEGSLPEDWKTADVTAIFKKGNKSDPGNYRPVSLTSPIGKVLESFIKDQLQDFMESNNFLSDCQHGFRSNRSCVTQLLQTMNDLTKYTDNHENVDMFYLDFSKAFDTVPHQRLLSKLSAYGISGKILDWIANFLQNRKQRVKVGTSYSSYSNIDSGIPQGSILGPTLFIIFINDLPEHVKSNCKIFADDSKIYGPSSDHSQLQKDLDSLMKWSNTWQLKFNIKKCSVLYFGKKNPKIPYSMDDGITTLKETDCEKDVGVHFSSNLFFDEHINITIKKANQMCGIIKRSFSYLDKDMFLKLYKSIVRSKLEYGNVIWHPIFKRQSRSLEKVQRRATKLVPNLKHLSYKERLKSLKLPTIKYRQIRGDLIQVFKIVHSIDNICQEEFFNLNSNNTRNSDLKIQKEYASSTIRRNFLPLRISNTWNNLSLDTKKSQNINIFKNNVDRELQNIMFEFDE